MKTKFIASILIAQIFFCQFVFAQRGVKVRVKKENGKTEEINLYDGSFALVIGESKYSGGWDDLPGVANDVVAVRQVLSRQGFQVETAENLTSAEIDFKVKEFIDNYGFDPNNRLVLYYAGHGHTEMSATGEREKGFIVPVDAPNPSKNLRGFKQKAIDMDTIQNYATRIEAKHAIFIFDSCFSGKLISRGEVKVPPIIEEYAAYPVRQFITAGAATQTVPDDSVFRKTFVRGLNGEADRNNDGYVTGSELADYLKEQVTNYSKRTQTPQYGKINNVDLNRGDFVFVVPKAGDKVLAENLTQQAIEKLAFGDFEEAYRLADAALNVRDDIAWAIFIKGIVGKLLSNELAPNVSESIAAQAFEADPQNGFFLFLSSGGVNSVPSEERKNIEEKALKLMETPQTFADYFIKGLFLLELRSDTKEGWRNLDQSILLNPKCVLCRYVRAGKFLGNFSEISKALIDLNEIIRLNPKFHFAYLRRAEIYKTQKLYDQAIADYTKVLELNPRYMFDNWVLYISRAEIYELKGEKAKAEADRRKADDLLK